MADLESKLRERLEELRAEYEKGRRTLEELETQAASVRATLLRISGAAQVLQEELGAAEGAKDPRPAA
jgi:predicted nuclease with TOPRIM domain